MLRTAAIALLLLLSSVAQDAEATKTLKRFHELRPGDSDLAMYRLDWAPTLAAAQQRAAAEKRPVLLIVIHAQYGDMITGHC